MSNPKVSIIMSVYNGQEYLSDCITGINSQTFGDYEVVVIDDGSTDSSSAVIREWKKQNDRVRIIERQNDGLTTALNLAISESSGKFLARHDADDISSPQRIKEQVEFLSCERNAVLASSHCVEFKDLSNLISLYCPPDNPALIKKILQKGENVLYHGSVMMYKKAFLKLGGGYRFRYAQDYDLYLRISSLGDIRVVPEVLYALRNHPSRTAVSVRDLKKAIHELIMQVNGIAPWDPKYDVLTAGCEESEQWRCLQDYVISRNVTPTPRRCEAQYFLSLIGDSLERHERKPALAYSLRAIRSAPHWWKSWVSMPYAVVGSLLPSRLIGRWRGRGRAAGYRIRCEKKSLAEIFTASC